MASPEPHRLPRTVLPERYDLEIVPDLERRRFSGSVTVTLRVAEPVTEITLNAADLSVASAEVTDPDGGVQSGSVALDAEAERATVRFERPLPAGAGSTLTMSFSGELNDALRGFYRSTFVDRDGVTRTIGVTQFESTDARRAFPCWDEPDMKAVFAVSLVVSDGLTALSSGAVAGEEPAEGGARRVRFADTIPMSTYVLAWVIGPFELTDPAYAAGVAVRVAAPAGRSELTAYSVGAAAHALRWFSDYFAVAYPGSKLDHVAVPDFAFGAMENLGCITYRETALLADPDRASQQELMRVAEVVAHETAHMWFGDLVTMKWWNGIWLNEAFATFMELKAVEALRPDWDVWANQTAGKAEAMSVDGVPSTRPIEYEVRLPEDAEAMFDSLTYEKGGAVLRMLEQFLGEETFRRGIARYLDEHRFANTETADLWKALEAESGVAVRSVMESWIFQAGYPLVTVEPGPGVGTVRLSQRRFGYLGEAEGHWTIPVILRAGLGATTEQRRILLDEPQTVELGAPPDWVVANHAGAGFYRVATHPSLRPPAAELTRHCTPIERVGVLADAWAAVAAGDADLGDYLSLGGAAVGPEDDPDVWRTVAASLGLLERIAVGEGEKAALRALVGRWAGPAWSRLGWDPRPDEPARPAMTRGVLVGLLGTVAADPGVRAEAASRHRRFLDTGSGLCPEVLTGTVEALAAAGDDRTWELLLGCSEAGATPQDRIRYLLALAAFEAAALARRTLDLALSERVRSQDGPLLVGRVLAGPCGGDVAWPWVEEHLESMLGRFPRSQLVRVFAGVASLTEAADADAVHRFFATHSLPIGRRRVAQIEERLDVTVGLAARLRPTLAADLAAG